MNQSKQPKKPIITFHADKLKVLATKLVDFNASVVEGNKSDVDTKYSDIINVLSDNGCGDIARYMKLKPEDWDSFTEALKNSNLIHDFKCAIIFAQYHQMSLDKNLPAYKIEQWRNHIAMLPIKAFKDSSEAAYKVHDAETTQMGKLRALATQYSLPVINGVGEIEKEALLSIKKIGYNPTVGKELKALSVDGESLANVEDKDVCTIINAYDMSVGYNEVNTVLNNMNDFGLLQNPLHNELLANIQTSLGNLTNNGAVNTMLKKLSKVDANGDIKTVKAGFMYGTNDTPYTDAIKDCEKVYANLSVARDSAITLLIKASEEILKDPLSQKVPNFKAIVDALKKANKLKNTAEITLSKNLKQDADRLPDDAATSLHTLFKMEQEAIKRLVASLGKVIEAKAEVINTQPFHYTSPILDPSMNSIVNHRDTRVNEFGNTSNATKLSNHIESLVMDTIDKKGNLYSRLVQNANKQILLGGGYEKDQAIIQKAIIGNVQNDNTYAVRFYTVCSKYNKNYTPEQITTIAEKALKRSSKMTENGVERDLLNDMKDVCGVEGDFSKIFKQLFLVYQANDGMLDNDKNLGENRANRFISIINYTLLQYGVQVSGQVELAQKSRAMYTLFTLLSARFQKTCQAALGVTPRMIDFSFEDIAGAIKSCVPEGHAAALAQQNDDKNSWKTKFEDKPLVALDNSSAIATFSNIKLTTNPNSKLSDIYKVSAFKLYQKHVSPDRKKIETNIAKREKNNKMIGSIEQGGMTKKASNWMLGG